MFSSKRFFFNSTPSKNTSFWAKKSFCISLNFNCRYTIDTRVFTAHLWYSGEWQYDAFNFIAILHSIGVYILLASIYDANAQYQIWCFWVMLITDRHTYTRNYRSQFGFRLKRVSKRVNPWISPCQKINPKSNTISTIYWQEKEKSCLDRKTLEKCDKDEIICSSIYQQIFINDEIFFLKFVIYFKVFFKQFSDIM